jgi:type IV pilus assembly protein PilE
MMRLSRRKNSGFTLLELIIVIVIIGILASIAMPRFFRTAERSRAVEALSMLGSIRTAMQRYYAANGAYTGATLDNLDIDNPNNATLYPNALFSYTLAVPTGTTFTATATRNSVKGGDGTSTITINQDGNITGTGVFTGI